MTRASRASSDCGPWRQNPAHWVGLDPCSLSMDAKDAYRRTRVNRFVS
jgi:hypothetical protein